MVPRVEFFENSGLSFSSIINKMDLSIAKPCNLKSRSAFSVLDLFMFIQGDKLTSHCSSSPAEPTHEISDCVVYNVV